MVVSFNRPVVCPTLIGRAHDLEALNLLVDSVKGGQGYAALVSGEAGIGKSRMVTEVKTYAAQQGFLSLQGNCFQVDNSFPYAPLRDLLRTYLISGVEAGDDLEPYAQDLSKLLPDLPLLLPRLVSSPSKEATSDPEQEKRRIFTTLTHFFVHQAARQPVLCIIEDLHWCDDTTLAFLLSVVRRCVQQPVLFLFTYRSDEVQPTLRHTLAQMNRERLAQEFPLSHLSRDDIQAMLQAIFALQGPVLPETLDALLILTEGNPFFIEEILKSLVTAGEIFYAGGTWKRKSLQEMSIPQSVQDAVQQRTGHLSLPAKQVLTLASVAGRRFDFALLQQVMGCDEEQLLVLIKELIAAQLVIEESAEQFAFRHALTRQAIYENLLVRERRTLHRTMAEAIEQLHGSSLQDAQVANLADHFYKAGIWKKALEYGQRAGETALALYAPRSAIEHVTRALEAAQLQAIAPIADLYRMRGKAYDILGEFEQARQDYTQALDAARKMNNRAAEWQSAIDLGFLWAGRDYTQAETWFRQALVLSQALDDPVLHARSLNRIGNWHLNVEQPHEALRYHQEALTIFQQLHDARGIAETLDLLGMTSYLGGDLIEGTTYYQQAIALFEELGNREGLTSSLATLALRASTYQTDALIVTTSLAEVLPDADRSVRVAREIGQRSAESYALFQSGLCLGSQGEYTRALTSCQQSLQIAEEIEHRQWQTAAHATLGGVYNDLLAHQHASDHLEQALILAQETHSLVWTRIITGYLASATIQLHDLARAETLLHAALKADTPAQTMAQRMAWCAFVELALAQGNPAHALNITDQLIASTVHADEGQSSLRVLKLRGEALAALQRHAEAEATFKRAQELARMQGARPAQWRIWIALGNLYHAQGHHAEAEQAFASARALIEELATTIADEPLRDHFLRQAATMFPQKYSLASEAGRGARQAPGGLTAREREVAILIAQGKSNQTIADTLVVTKRTVETHIGNIMFKLDCASRTQIAVWAVETGLASFYVERAGE
ncbi:MAG TPA: tetratricopeptide repeat protein [Ktedonobacteraceae bacterium]|nr:tetratricopeptide repeat protein [Ktedonobacteraceae bacterium]